MVIVGLGNPGTEYRNTRHNLGFVVLDRLAEQLNVRWSVERHVLVARAHDHWLVKPQLFMNRSGEALKDFLHYRHLSTDIADLKHHLLIIHDELDFPPGEWKQQHGRSSAGHNGVQSIIDAFGTKDFERLRIGIGTGKSLNIPNEDYVLQVVPTTELKTLDQAIREIVEHLLINVAPSKP